MLQPHHFINTSTNPDGGHVSNYIRQIKVQNQYWIFPKHQNYRDGGKLSCSRILSDGEFQLTDPWSAKRLVEKAQKYKYTVSQKNLYRKSLNICKDPCRSGVVLT